MRATVCSVFLPMFVTRANANLPSHSTDHENFSACFWKHDQQVYQFHRTLRSVDSILLCLISLFYDALSIRAWDNWISARCKIEYVRRKSPFLQRKRDLVFTYVLFQATTWCSVYRTCKIKVTEVRKGRESLELTTMSLRKAHNVCHTGHRNPGYLIIVGHTHCTVKRWQGWGVVCL